MKFSGKAWVISGFMITSMLIILLARGWPAAAAMFPVAIATFVLAVGGTELYLVLFKSNGKEAQVMDLKLSESEDPATANRRTLVIFFWIFGLLFLIVFLGLPLAIPIFLFLYLRLEGKEGWGISIGLTAGVYGFFYFLFIWLLKTPCQTGWIQAWLGRG